MHFFDIPLTPTRVSHRASFELVAIPRNVKHPYRNARPSRNEVLGVTSCQCSKFHGRPLSVSFCQWPRTQQGEAPVKRNVQKNVKSKPSHKTEQQKQLRPSPIPIQCHTNLCLQHDRTEPRPLKLPRKECEKHVASKTTRQACMVQEHTL